MSRLLFELRFMDMLIREVAVGASVEFAGKVVTVPMPVRPDDATEGERVVLPTNYAAI